MARIRVLVADAHRMFAEGVAGSLRAQSDLAVFEDYPTSGPEAVETVRKRRPNVAVIDYWMPEMEGPAIAAALAARAPGVKVILLSSLVAAGNIQSAIKSGAAGFLPKSATVEQLAEAIRSAHAGGEPVLARQLQKMVDRLG
ncbi:MAG: response regulator, partial [Actinomycetota bacterium]